MSLKDALASGFVRFDASFLVFFVTTCSETAETTAARLCVWRCTHLCIRHMWFDRAYQILGGGQAKALLKMLRDPLNQNPDTPRQEESTINPLENTDRYDIRPPPANFFFSVAAATLPVAVVMHPVKKDEVLVVCRMCVCIHACVCVCVYMYVCVCVRVSHRHCHQFSRSFLFVCNTHTHKTPNTKLDECVDVPPFPLLYARVP
jgi:hypothetical protein